MESHVILLTNGARSVLQVLRQAPLDPVLSKCTLEDHDMISIVDKYLPESHSNRKIDSTSQEKSETYRRDLRGQEYETHRCSPY